MDCNSQIDLKELRAHIAAENLLYLKEVINSLTTEQTAVVRDLDHTGIKSQRHRREKGNEGKG